MEFDGDTKFGNSQINDVSSQGYINFKGDKNALVLEKTTSEFKTSHIGTHDRKVDSEAKLFEYAASVAKDGKEHTLNVCVKVAVELCNSLKKDILTLK